MNVHYIISGWVGRDLKILLPSETYGDPLEINMPDWRPIGDLEMLHWRLICLIRDASETDMPGETHWRPPCRGVQSEFTHAVQSEFTHISLNILIFIYFLLLYNLNNVMNLIRHVGLLCMLVSDVSLIRNL